ncbi:acyl-CoA-binding protein (ACBP)/diazepam binding inhibitor (DBI)/endozepine (EP) [Tieghemiomyces parasiticus]|uniref:Acyl-CoA-binding protein (ACBP)/diazepam binding inhibitor (DBI)/endozepine (EP) n=1 Tax=Tieghemiomyces parasiticus TaxID=78921 RepID=A0A9W8DQ13_9FUNG|nr:acyl-CoA-binding protein (ACBP)/diazepam binding inhibitor (DBI)/endozepine (EP) [Tieghemiomyces parasiticus]
MSEAASTGNQAFIQAAADAKSFTKKPTNDELLELYALFKQGIEGDNTTVAPGMFDLKGKAKHNAWTGKKGISKADAQAQYVALVEKLKATHA